MTYYPCLVVLCFLTFFFDDDANYHSYCCCYCYYYYYYYYTLTGKSSFLLHKQFSRPCNFLTTSWRYKALYMGITGFISAQIWH